MKVEAASGSLKSRATLSMPVMNHLRVQRHRLSRIKPPVARLHAEDLTRAVQIPQPHHQLPHHGVHPGAQTPARDDGCAHALRLEVDRLPRTGLVVRRVGPRGGELVGDVVEDVAEDEVGGGDVELG